MGTRLEKLKNTIHLFFSHHTEEYYNRTFTISVKGRKFHICARCSGVILSFIAAFSYSILARLELEPLLSLIIAIILTIPVMIDWGTQKLGFRESRNSIRFTTGALLGIGMTLLQYTYELQWLPLLVIGIFLAIFFIIAMRGY